MNISYANAPEVNDLAPCGTDHSFHLMELALMQCDMNLGPVIGDGERELCGEAFFAPVNGHSRGKKSDGGLVQRGGKLGIIELFHMIFRGEHTVRKNAVIGDENEALGVLVEPACGKKPLSAQVFGDKLNDRFRESVPDGADNARRLVQHDIDVPAVLYRLPIDRNFVRSGSYLHVKKLRRHTVHGYNTPFYELPDLVPAEHSLLG